MPRPRTTPKPVVELPSSLARWPGYVMKYVFEAWYIWYEHEVARLGLSVNGLLVLVALDADGPETQSVLAERISVDRSLMVSVVDDLERQGLVERRRSEEDRRAVPIHITDAGHEFADRASDLTDAANDRVFAGFTRTERSRFVELLDRLPSTVVEMRREQELGVATES